MKRGDIHDALAEYVERGEIPGLIGLIKRGDEVHVEALGTLALDGAQPVTRDSIFRVASMTKPVTAVATMMLIEDGLLSLDDPVERLLPELADMQVLRSIDAEIDDTMPAKRSITVWDLLTFTHGSGLVIAEPGTYPIQRAMEATGLGDGPPRPGTFPEPDVWIAMHGSLPLMHQPGEGWMYNTGSDILGVLIARAADQEFDAFLRERIFEPLGMGDTDFWVPEAKMDRFATSYMPDFESGELTLNDPAIGGRWSQRPAFQAGGGGLASTLDDYLAFSEMLLGGGAYRGQRLLSQESVQLMTQDHVPAAVKATSTGVDLILGGQGWGFGLQIVTRPSSATGPAGTFGWAGGLGTAFSVDPVNDQITMLLTQVAFSSPAPPAVFVDFWRLAYRDIA